MIDPRAASGLRDIPPSVMIPRERMLETFRKTFASFGYLPIETPHIERMEVLTGKGAGSDEVLRQIFDVTNKGGTPGELGLRFDLTVPLARFMAKHVDELGVPFKRYAIGSVFRGERPAKGRFREFVQCDFDSIGADWAIADAEVALVIYAALSAAGAPPFTIALNHRGILVALLTDLGLFPRQGVVLRAIDKLGKVGREGVLRELLKAGTPAAEMVADQFAITQEKAERIVDFVEQSREQANPLAWVLDQLHDEKAKYFASAAVWRLRNILDLLDVAGVPAICRKVDFSIARGLDYYTGVVFETTINGWEQYGSVSSGGRYDDLAQLFTSRHLPGVGASIGLDRLLALMQDAGSLGEATSTAPVLVTTFSTGDDRSWDLTKKSFELASTLRASGIGAEVYPHPPTQIGKQLGYGSTRGHRFAVIVGPDEYMQGVFNLRDLKTRQEQKGIPWSDLVQSVKSALSVRERASS